jgi:hypothetical protein
MSLFLLLNFNSPLLEGGMNKNRIIPILSESAVPQADSLWQEFRNTLELAAGIGILALR